MLNKKRFALVFFLAFLSLIGFILVAAFPPYEISEYYPEDYKRAVESGSAKDQYKLGKKYYGLYDFPEHNKEAVKWYSKAAEQGLAAAQLALGRMYEKGEGIPRDYNEAIKWYTKAADQGNEGATLRLANLYFSTIKDYDEAIKWYAKAADQGNSSAQQKIYFGQGFSKGNERVIWLTKAAELGYLGAQWTLGDIYYKGQIVQQNYEEAFKWLIKAAERSYYDQNEPHWRQLAALTDLGVKYYNGDGVHQDIEKAGKCFEMGANLGDRVAQYNFGLLNYYGHAPGQGTVFNDVPDYKMAIEWFKKSAEQGYAKAQYILAEMYYDGKGAQQDYVKAIHWYTKPANQGFSKVQTRLGEMFYKGLGVQKSYKEAVQWWMKAAEQGDALAQIYLGDMYFKGIGVIEDRIEAYKWYLIANMNNPDIITEDGTNLTQRKNRLTLYDERFNPNVLTPEQIAEAQKRAKTFVEISNINFGVISNDR